MEPKTDILKRLTSKRLAIEQCFSDFQVNHCGSLYLVGWQPARQNFILKLNLQGETVT